MRDRDSTARLALSVVIPCFNAGPHITGLLGRLREQTVGVDLYEVIVVDDGSTDDTRDRVARFDAKLLRQARSGPGAARNLGTEHAAGELVLYLDADLEVDADLLERHLAFHREHPQIAATGGSVLPAREPGLFSWQLVDHLSSWFNAHPSAHHQPAPEYLPSLNFCIKRDLVAERHGVRWTAGLTHTGEDVVYCHQLRGAGLPISFLPDAPVRHHDRATLSAYLRHTYGWGHHAPYVRGSIAGLAYGFLFPRFPGLLVLTLPVIVLGYTALVWKSWLRQRPIAVTLALPQIFLGRLAYAAGVAGGTWSMRAR